MQLRKKLIQKKLSKLEKQILDFYEPITSYGNGRFRNLSGGDDEGHKEFRKEFPTYWKLVSKYISLLHQIKDENYIPLPPFIVFPTYSVSTIGWRMGDGEGYEGNWEDAIRSLSENKKKAYCNKYDYPMWWLDSSLSGLCPLRYQNLPWRNLADYIDKV